MAIREWKSSLPTLSRFWAQSHFIQLMCYELRRAINSDVTNCSFAIACFRWWSKKTWGSTCSSCMVAMVMLTLRSSRCLCCYGQLITLNWMNSKQNMEGQHESPKGVFVVTSSLVNRSSSTWWLIASLVTLKWNWVWYLKDPWKSFGFPRLPLISLRGGNVAAAWLVCFPGCLFDLVG